MADDRLPDHLNYDGIVISGSSPLVYWDEPWIRNLVSWVVDAGERGVPPLGVCFSHQVVAAAPGSTVEDMGASELGYNETERTHPDGGNDILAGIGKRLTVFTPCGDRVTELPSGADLLTEDEFGVHTFRRDYAFGVQFHPEYDTDAAEAIARQEDSFPDERIHPVVDNITPESYAAAYEAKRLFDNSVTYVSRTNAGPVESTV